MELFIQLIKAFVVGGVICAIGELLILCTKLTSARILVIYVTAGVILGALGLYGPIIEFAGAGASVPLTGFGYNLAKGAQEGARESGLLGALSGGVARSAAGISMSIAFGYIIALVCKPHTK